MEKTYTVSEFIDYLNTSLKSSKYTVEGEISDVEERGSTVFFSLIDKNDKSVLKCLIWKNKLQSLGFDSLEDGAEAKIVGIANIYKPSGKFTFLADYVSLTGEGQLKKALAKLKLELQGEGYFGLDRKRVIPDYISTVGLITSDGSDAQKDFLTHLGSFGYKIYFFDVRVEGVQAIDNIASAIKWFNENTKDIQALVITRGGGSLESLQAFNSKDVAKAIFGSKIPIVTAIGHENDVTISDLVADLSVSTPTDAGKTLSESWRELPNILDSSEKNIEAFFKKKYQEVKDKIESYELSFTGGFRKMMGIIKQIEEKFYHNYERFSFNLKRTIQTIDQFEKNLVLSNPGLKLKQGYSITTDVYGRIIKNFADVKVGDKLRTKLYKGSVNSIANEKNND